MGALYHRVETNGKNVAFIRDEDARTYSHLGFGNVTKLFQSCRCDEPLGPYDRETLPPLGVG